MNFDDPIASFWHDWIYSALFIVAALSIIAYTNWEKRQAEAADAEALEADAEDETAAAAAGSEDSLLPPDS